LDAAKTHVNPENLVIVVVGDKATIEDGLSEIQSPITICDFYGNPV
jgi:hypothetical protein